MQEKTQPLELRRVCGKCGSWKLKTEYYRNRSLPDGLYRECKACVKVQGAESGFRFQKRRSRKLPNLRSLVKENQPEKVQRIYDLLVADRKMSCEKVAEAVGLTPKTVRQYMYTNEFLRAFRNQASMNMSLMVPVAVAAIQDSLNARSEDVKLRAAVKVLESENVMGPQKLDITVNDLSNKSHSDLLKILEQTPLVPTPSLDAEIVS